MNEAELVKNLSQLMAKPKITTYPNYQEVTISGVTSKIPIINSVVTLQQVGRFG